ncbi:unnamed protein product [Fraxinus pennsylvanica]|uniref:Uncharacterized protein n=1 Tax=Fraxinus pennsylvanica TaxID=56036 RepID=A0AAD1ZPQ5_9LAMI|nr:unnamed protein product [Fraxinus pennsylvanica]
MASSVLMKRTGLIKSIVNSFGASRAYASVAVGTDLLSTAPDVSLQKARSWDEGVSSKFATTPLKDIFKEIKKLSSLASLVHTLEFVRLSMYLATRTTLISSRQKELTR